MLLAKALTGKMIIPDFAEFKKDVRPLFEETKKNISGEVSFLVMRLYLEVCILQ